MKRHQCYVLLQLSGLLVLPLIESLATYPTLEFQPSRVVVDHVSQSYPATLFRTLFSSVPKREYALHNVALCAESEMVVLLGASSSGKSTLLRLIANIDTPVTGSVYIQSTNGQATCAVQPVMLDQKPPYDDSQTVWMILDKLAKKDCEHGMVPDIIRAMCDSVGLEDSELQKKPSQLSPSENYRYGLARAGLQSILPAVKDMSGVDIPSPVLLLDEWMDLEPSSIVHRVEEAMLRMNKFGAVIFCATHKPHLFAKSHRAVTLCRGEVLSEGTTK